MADSRQNVLLLESGGLAFDAGAQKLYQGSETGVSYVALDGGRLRFLGGSTNHWGGWCRPLDKIDFENRDWVPHSGWPFARSEIEPYFARAQSLVEAGPWIYDTADRAVSDSGPILRLAPGGVYTSWFQFSKTHGGNLPTHFGERYQNDLKRAPRVTPLLNANVTGIHLSANTNQVERPDIATPSGNRVTRKPRSPVLAAGAIENARLLLASNDVAIAGVGNANDLV